MNYFGIDIGCTAIKFGEVHLANPIETIDFDLRIIQQNQRTRKYTEALIDLLQQAECYRGIGIGFPSVVWENRIMNLELQFNQIWNTVDQFLQSKNVPHFAINDADAAGFAEIYNPLTREYRKGVTVVLTLGTGIGSGLFVDGKLLPNSELGMMEINGMLAEEYAAASVIQRANLSIGEWASRLQKVITQVETILTPDHILLGGGISSDFERYRDLLTTRWAKLAPTHFRNQSGVVGAAMYAAYRSNDYNL